MSLTTLECYETGLVHGMLDIVKRHLERYPLMLPRDVYKLFYQATMGPAHAVDSIRTAGERLKAEMELPDHGPDEPLIDPISPSGELARVHLRSWKRAGLSPEPLLAAFAGTPDRFTGSREALENLCDSLLDGSDRFGSDPRGLLEEVRKTGYPALHHSQRYRESYSPSYRVVLVALLPASLRGGISG